MIRRRYEVYGVAQDEELQLRKVVLGSSPELAAVTHRPESDAAVEVLAADDAVESPVD